MSIHIIKNNGVRVSGQKTSSFRLNPPISTVRDWIDAGGQASENTITAMQNFFLGLYADGITWGINGKIKRLNLFCGNRLEDCLRPQIITLGSATETNNGFVASDYIETSSTGGLVSSSGGKYLSTGVSNTDSAIPQTNYSISVYAKYSSFPGDNTYAIGSDTSHRSLSFYGTQSRIYFIRGGAAGYTTTLTQGHFLGSENTGPSNQIYRNGSAAASVDEGFMGVNAGIIQVFATNYPTYGVTLNSSIKLAMYHIGQSMTATEVSNFYTRIQAFQTALGRQV